MIKTIFAAMIILGSAILTIWAMQTWYKHHPLVLPDQHSIEVCKKYAPITAAGFKGTEFEDFDFYGSCLLNISDTSPVLKR